MPHHHASCVVALQFPLRFFPPQTHPLPLRPPLFSAPRSILHNRAVALFLLPLLFPTLAQPLYRVNY